MLRKKILIVDDSATILMMERMILNKWPYDLVTATNGEEAVRFGRVGKRSATHHFRFPKSRGREARMMSEDDVLREVQTARDEYCRQFE